MLRQGISLLKSTSSKRWGPLFCNQRNLSGIPEADYAVEMACSNIRYGPGVSQEVGKDLINLRAKKVLVVTDKNVAKLPIMKTIQESLDLNKVNYDVYSDVRVEPTDESFNHAIAFGKKGNYDAFVGVGGGSALDTCKAVNLYVSHPDAELLDFVNAPIGKAKPIYNPVKPLIAVATTAGTGSETTGTAIFDYVAMNAKTGISNRALKPLLGIVDPLTLQTCPNRVTCYAGFDVLCHAIESYTALPFNERRPRPSNPALRPAYQGSNQISDVWSKYALEITGKFLKRAVNNNDDMEARSQMHLASAFAGIGFGNAGVHLCHGMSYPISGMIKSYHSPDYSKDHALVPHGLSVVISSPAVFNFTAPACPDRHLECARILGADVSRARKEDAGPIIADTLRKVMYDLKLPSGLKELGYSTDCIPGLVAGTLPQERVTKLSPRKAEKDDFHQLFEESMKNF